MGKDSNKQKIRTIEELKNDEALFKKIIKIAQFESEMDLGVNPKDFDQAHVGYLTEDDFEYIDKVCMLVEKRLKDTNWLSKTLKNLEDLYDAKATTFRGIRFDDELFKAGHGILETHLKELKDKR